MIKLATACMKCEFDKQANLAKILKMIDEAADNGADFIAFPEQALQGYLRTNISIHFEDDEMQYQYDNAETVPDGPSVKAIVDKAIARKIYVVFGMTERDAEYDYKMYNSAVLTGPKGYIGTYRKVHLPMDELHIYYPGFDFPVFNTEIGKIGMLICYDKCFPETSRELALGGADILVMSTAYSVSSLNLKPEEFKQDQMYFTYDIFDRVRALENQCFFISSNQTGLTGDTLYFGCSNIVNPSGHIVSTTDIPEGIAYYESESIKNEIYTGKTKAFMGLSFLKDRSPRAYKRMSVDNIR